MVIHHHEEVRSKQGVVCRAAKVGLDLKEVGLEAAWAQLK